LSEAFAGTVVRRPATCTDNVGVVGPKDGSPLRSVGGCAREDCERKARIDLPDKGRRRVLDRDIGAMWRRLNGDEPCHALFSG
jgi:hypothetical protein